MPHQPFLAAFLCAVALAAPAGAQQAPETEATPSVVGEGAPVDPVKEAECNLPCQLLKLRIIPGGGGGITAGKEIDSMGGVFDGLELGVTRPAAEDFHLNSNRFDLGQGQKLQMQNLQQ